MGLKNLVKRAGYAIHSPRITLDGTVTLGYVFHTERIHDDAIFSRLIQFCRWYHEQTGTRAVCTVMSAVNPLIEGLLAQHRCTPDRYADRVHELSEVALIGYHGHFWRPGTPFEALFTRKHGYIDSIPVDEYLEQQLIADLDWFTASGVHHNGIYAAGWWYLQPRLMELLAGHGLELDVSHSHSTYHQTPQTRELLLQHDIPAGKSFRYRFPTGSMTCVQYLTGCHTTPFPQCFYRAITRLGAGNGFAESVSGFVGAHDFDLDYVNTTTMIQVLSDHPKFKFADAVALGKRARADREIVIPPSESSGLT